MCGINQISIILQHCCVKSVLISMQMYAACLNTKFLSRHILITNGHFLFVFFTDKLIPIIDVF